MDASVCSHKLYFCVNLSFTSTDECIPSMTHNLIKEMMDIAVRHLALLARLQTRSHELISGLARLSHGSVRLILAALSVWKGMWVNSNTLKVDYAEENASGCKILRPWIQQKHFSKSSIYKALGVRCCSSEKDDLPAKMILLEGQFLGKMQIKLAVLLRICIIEHLCVPLTFIQRELGSLEDSNGGIMSPFLRLAKKSRRCGAARCHFKVFRCD